MPRPRKALVCRADTPYYHCVSRCVRRAFLCGQDNATGNCYEHRRDWISERLHLLSSLFAIDICAYAIMSNHYHLVLKLDTSESWSENEVITRWLTLYKGPPLVQRYLSGQALSPAQRETVSDIIRVWRHRLQNLSWFMKCLNEPIARKANREDCCSGHFWEARFKSQALRTEQALLSCMAYVDLNPIRAGVADTPEASDYTSIQERVTKPLSLTLRKAIREAQGLQAQVLPVAEKPLLHFEAATKQESQFGIPFAFCDYLQLLDWTGRQARNDKRGAISSKLPPILTRLAITPEQWWVNSTQFEQIFHRRFGRAA